MQDIQRRKTPFALRPIRTDNGPAIASHSHMRHRGLTVLITRHVPSQLVLVPRMIQPQRAGHVGVGGHAVMQEHGLGRDGLIARNAQPFDLGVADHLKLGDIAIDGDARTADFPQAGTDPFSA